MIPPPLALFFVPRPPFVFTFLAACQRCKIHSFIHSFLLLDLVTASRSIRKLPFILYQGIYLSCNYIILYREDNGMDSILLPVISSSSISFLVHNTSRSLCCVCGRVPSCCAATLKINLLLLRLFLDRVCFRITRLLIAPPLFDLFPVLGS